MAVEMAFNTLHQLASELDDCQVKWTNPVVGCMLVLLDGFSNQMDTSLLQLSTCEGGCD